MQISDLRSTFERKLEQVQTELKNKQVEIETQKELLEDANNILNMFNDEKHEVKAKFKYLMQLIDLPAMTDSQLDSVPLSSYKGRDDEVDLLACFQELEQIVLNFKQTKDDKIDQLSLHNEQKERKIGVLENELSKVQKQLCELTETLASVQVNNDLNNKEVRTQLELAKTKIQSYKDKLTAKTEEAKQLEAELAEARATLTESVGDASVIKENAELLQKL